MHLNDYCNSLLISNYRHKEKLSDHT